jgi:hypothetical protein
MCEIKSKRIKSSCFIFLCVVYANNNDNGK